MGCGCQCLLGSPCFLCAGSESESGRGVASFLFWLLQRQPASFDGQQLQQQQRWMMMDGCDDDSDGKSLSFRFDRVVA